MTSLSNPEAIEYVEKIRCARCNDELGDVTYTADTGQVMALCTVCGVRSAVVMVHR